MKNTIAAIALAVTLTALVGVTPTEAKETPNWGSPTWSRGGGAR